jgi:hypothetical protein
MAAIESTASSFHLQQDTATVTQVVQTLDFSAYSYDFENFFHPLIGTLIRTLNEATGDPIEAMLDPDTLAAAATPASFFFQQYTVGPSEQPHITANQLDFDLSIGGPYANYNWELGFHIPIAVALHCSQNQRFPEAQKWFHYVFDPTATDPDPSVTEPFWKFLYFRQNPPALDLLSQLTLLSTPDGELSDPDVAAKQGILTAYHASVMEPFSPFPIARARPLAFQYFVVMAYLDNLIAWGDSLFSQMTIETVNEATLCYVLAANLLGPRPQQIPPLGTTGAKCFNDLRPELGVGNPLSDALVTLEGQFPFNLTASVSPTADSTATSALFGIGNSLYFCVPPNDKLLGYWDTVDDRLSKIRNCENIAGQVQLMPLFDPPIDPGMLVAATAAGLDLSSVLNGLSQPVSPVRAPLLIQQALDLCAEVKSLGAELLAAIEKGDAEALARLRQNNEIALGKLTQNIRYLQWQQAQASTEALLRSRDAAMERYTFYLRELGLTPDTSTVPQEFTVDHTTVLTEDNFADAYQSLVGKYDQTITPQTYPTLQLAQSSSPATQSGASGPGQLYLNTNEDAELNTHMPTERDEHLAASVADTVAAVLTPIPDVDGKLHYWGIGVSSKVFGGGMMLAYAGRVAADVLRTLAGWEHDQGAMAARTAGYQRRADDWLYQGNLAAHELSQIGRQILTSILTEQAAGAEYEAAKAQVGQSQDVLTFLRTKFTSKELYGWMQGQLATLYYQYYGYALDTARKAEATMQWELMRPEVDATTYIQPNYWDAGHQGLLAGESLYIDIKRMELDYATYNLRELELTRHVSLRQLDPVALLDLKTTGSCTVTVPEWLYDRDCPGHYLRRIKSVALSIPSVVGPYTSVNCTLTLQHSSVRIASQAGPSYERSQTGDDSRFVDYYGTLQTVVTSGAVADSGMFETNLTEPRFLPFEGAGAISTWTLGLPEMASFDYTTITDVILHVRYTARDGGAALGTAAAGSLQKQLPPNPGGSDPAPALALLLSLRHDFPTEWYAFATGSGDFTATLTMNYFPYVVQSSTLSIDAITLYAEGEPPVAITTPTFPVTMSLQSPHDQLALDFPADGTVLVSGDLTSEVYAVITYTAKPPPPPV